MLKIMLVDDDKMVIEDFVNLIDWKNLGFSIVSTANNGKLAFENFKKYLPDIVITDVVMPVMKGTELLSQIKQISPETVVILISSYAEFSYAKQAIEKDAFGYLLKDEINAGNLTEIMSKAKDYINSQNNAINPFIGQPKESLSNLRKAYYYMICEIDVPLSLVGVLLRTAIPENRILEAETQFFNGCFNNDFSIHNVFLLSNNRLMFEVSDEMTSHSQTGKKERLQLFAREIQQNYRKKFDRTISIFLIYEKLGLSDIFDAYRQADSKISNKYLLGTELIIDIKSDALSNHGTFHGLNAGMLTTMIKKGDKSKTLETIDQAFLEVRQKNDYLGLAAIVETCINVMGFIAQEIDYLLWDDHFSARMFENMFEAYSIKQWIESKLLELFDRIASDEKYSAHVLKAIRFIDTHYTDEQLNIQNISDAVELSATHLGVIFKKETGLTIGDYITSVRIEKAKELLSDKKYKMYDIAARVGYGSSQYFSQVFQKVTGCKPKEYRRNGSAAE